MRRKLASLALAFIYKVEAAGDNSQIGIFTNTAGCAPLDSGCDNFLKLSSAPLGACVH